MCNLCPGNASDNHKQHFSLHLSIFRSRIASAAITLCFFLQQQKPHVTTAPNEFQNLTEIMLFFNYLLNLSQRRTKTEDRQTSWCCTPQHPPLLHWGWIRATLPACWGRHPRQPPGSWSRGEKTKRAMQFKIHNFLPK